MPKCWRIGAVGLLVLSNIGGDGGTSSIMTFILTILSCLVLLGRGLRQQRWLAFIRTRLLLFTAAAFFPVIFSYVMIFHQQHRADSRLLVRPSHLAANRQSNISRIVGTSFISTCIISIQLFMHIIHTYNKVSYLDSNIISYLLSYIQHISVMISVLLEQCRRRWSGSYPLSSSRLDHRRCRRSNRRAVS
jgi:hypothetical protein